MKSRRCSQGRHDYPDEPYRVDAGYQQAPDGSRIDGRWLSFRCDNCGHIAERWESDDPRSEQLPPRTWHESERGEPRTRAPRSIWEKPAVYVILVALVLAAAAYGYYWDSRVERALRRSPEQSSPVK